MISTEEIAMKLYFNWWNKAVDNEEWSKVSEETRECYRSQAREVFGMFVL